MTPVERLLNSCLVKLLAMALVGNEIARMNVNGSDGGMGVQ